MAELIEEFLDEVNDHVEEENLLDKANEDRLMALLINICTNFMGNLVSPLTCEQSGHVVFRSLFNFYDQFMRRKDDWKTDNFKEMGAIFADFAFEFESFLIGMAQHVLPGEPKAHMQSIIASHSINFLNRFGLTSEKDIDNFVGGLNKVIKNTMSMESVKMGSQTKH